MSERVFVITGAFGILGRAVVERLRDQKLCLVDGASVPPVWAETGDRQLVLTSVDLADEAAAADAVGRAVERFGSVDVLINVAGGFVWSPVVAASADVWERMLRMNLSTAVNATRAALPFLSRSAAGRVVNVGAFAALRGAAGMGPYGAAKSGVHLFTQSLAEEVRGTGITVNAVLPSILDTPTNRADMPDADVATWVRPEELADLIVFLTSEQAAAVTGALIPVTAQSRRDVTP